MKWIGLGVSFFVWILNIDEVGLSLFSLAGRRVRPSGRREWCGDAVAVVWVILRAAASFSRPCACSGSLGSAGESWRCGAGSRRKDCRARIGRGAWDQSPCLWALPVLAGDADPARMSGARFAVPARGRTGRAWGHYPRLAPSAHPVPQTR